MSRITLPHKPTLGLKLMFCAALLAGLSACQDNDDDGPDGAGTGPGPATLTGTAAFGAPVAGGTVTAKCSNGSGFPTAVTTNAQGVFSGQVAPSALPCALRVSGGNLPAAYGSLHSLATASGRTNVTPLTDLVLALAVNSAAGQSLAAWFANPANLPQVSGSLSTALALLRSALNKAGYVIPSTWTAGSAAPFSAPFDPDPATDPYDALLEQLASGLATGTYEGYTAMLAAFVGGADLPDAPEEEGPASTQPATINGLLAKPYALVFKQAGGLGCGSSCSFANNQEVGATVGTNGTLTIGGKTLSAPFNRSSGGSFNTVEILWQDGQIVYALSNNQTGAFNEINVERVNGDGYEFLGQLVTADVEPPAATPLNGIKALAGSYDFSAHVVGTSNGDVSLQQPRVVRAHDSYPLCAALGATAGPGDQFGTSRAWPAQVVVAADGSVTVRNPDNGSQSFTLTPGRISADDVTVASAGSSNWQTQNPGGKLYSLRRSIRYNDGVHPQPLTENFEFLIGVTANGRFEHLEMRGQGNSPRMAFCGATLDRSPDDPLAPLKALAGSYTVTRNYLGTTAPWSTITIGSDGAIAFGGTGPNTGVAEIRKINAGRRNENNNGIDDSVWVVAVYVNRDLNGDTQVDNKDVILLFLTNDGALRDVQHLTASNQLVDVSVIDQALPAFDDSLAAALSGNGVSGKFDGGAQLVSSTQANANVSIYTQVSRLSLVARRDNFQQVPQNERKAWQVVVAPTAPAVPVAGQTYRCDNTGVGSQGQFTAVLFDSFGVGLDPQSSPNVQPTASSRIGGDCEVQMTRVVLNAQSRMQAAEGRFRAVLWNRDQKRFYDAVGFFRYDPPAP
ncbi:MAG TPA: hypothetical protein VGE22_10580 [Solimonas sp.]